MNLHVYIGGRWALKGSYPDSGAPATMAHIAAAAELNAASWIEGGYRVKFDDIEIGPVTKERFAATAEQFEIVTAPTPYAAGDIRKAA